MKELLETAYEEFASIAGSTWDIKVKRIALKDLYYHLEGKSEAFDNMIYERLGMSAEDALEMLDGGDTLP